MLTPDRMARGSRPVPRSRSRFPLPSGQREGSSGHRERLGRPEERRAGPERAGQDLYSRESDRLTCLLLGAKSLLPFRDPSALRASGAGARGARGGTPAGVAQLVEHLPCKQGVRGSSPLVSSGRRAGTRTEKETEEALRRVARAAKGSRL